MIKNLIEKYPAILLITFAYVFIIFVLLSFDHAWMQQEQIDIRAQILQSKTISQSFHIKHAFNWELFEYKPRISRPLSSYFEILDTKWRVWLWQFIPPHPSLSLTWTFSLILSPLFLFLLLRNLNVRPNYALTATALYLLSPGFLSFVVMQFRPAKAMTNFSIIFCLFYASFIHKRFLQSNNTSPLPSLNKNLNLHYISLIGIMYFSFFWDETALLIYPAMALLFPKLIWNKLRGMIFLFIPFLVLLTYTKIIPFLTVSFGYPMGELKNYDVVETIINGKFFPLFFQTFPQNSSLLILDTLGNRKNLASLSDAYENSL